MSPSFFSFLSLKIKAFFLFIWNLIKKRIKGVSNINVEQARDVLLIAPTISTGHDAKDITITIKPPGWPQRASSASSIVPTVLELPTVSSLDQRAVLVYKGTMRRLAKASKVLDPVLAQALYLCCMHKIAVMSKDNELAKFVETKLQKISTFRSQDGYIPPDIILWYKRFFNIDLRGNLVGVVIPVLEFASERMIKNHIQFGEVRKECKEFIRWLHTSITKPEESRFLFKGKNLNVGLVWVAGMDWITYLDIGSKLLKEEECDLLIVMAYGPDYSMKSTNVACFLEKLTTRDVGLSCLILTSTLASYEAEPFLASYFLFQPYFSDQKNKLIEEWNTWQDRLPQQNRIMITDEKIGFFDISKLLSGGKTVIVEHTWNTLGQFFNACFQIIIQNKARAICHKIEMRTDGGPTQYKPWACLSLILTPPRKL